MGKGIIIQLQEEALNDSIDIETLLRKAYFVARKLQLKEFEEWISCEQNGYHTEVPNYRYVGGEIKAWNPYHGWIPVIMEGKMADMLSSMPMSQPISSISDTYYNSDGAVSFVLGGELTDFLNKNTTAFETKYSFRSSKSELKKIISAVRNKILDWAILLEENGIIGEGLVFSETEKKTAQESSIINNYTNNFYSNTENPQIQQG